MRELHTGRIIKLATRLDSVVTDKERLLAWLPTKVETIDKLKAKEIAIKQQLAKYLDSVS